MSDKPDVNNGRPRWMNRYVFIQACVGSSIGLGNIWKFPYLTFKHGGWQFILAYAFALFVVGVPMMILELTLGQKMQRGSAGAQRGIMPRLAGAGWAASIAGYITCIIYTILLGMVLVYMVQGGAQPWKDYERPLACQTAQLMNSPDPEVYLFMNVTKLFGEDSCESYALGDKIRVAWGLYFAVVITWFICFLSIIKGPISIGYVTMVTEKLPFIFLFILLGKFVALNNSVDGKGIQYYFGTEKFPDASGVPYDPSTNYRSLFTDAYNQVFFSIGVCCGVMYAYGSYNHIKKPVIMDAVIICMLDFVFAILAGFITWGAIGYLQAKGDLAYTQTSSIGLTFIAFAQACSLDENMKGWFPFFMVFMYVSGIDSAFSYVEALVTNILDAQRGQVDRVLVSFLVCFFGALISLLFTTNFGWVLFDLVDHYISNYLILAVGLMQCVSCGWFFERDSTANMSPAHAKSLKWMHWLYWFPMVTIAFYANFAFEASFEIGVYLIFITTLFALFVSQKVSGMRSRIWYHEIMLCGVDKLSMSITSLSNADGSRSWWMLVFEGYFAVMIKFANPAVLFFLIIQNFKADMDSPYGEQPQEMQVYATTFLFAAYALIVGALFICDYPELFEHPVDLEFQADNMYAGKLKMQDRVEAMKQQMMAKGATPSTKGTVEMQNQSQTIPLNKNGGDKIEEL